MTGPSHRLLEHVAEAELLLEAPTEEGVFVAALDAFRELADGTGHPAGAPITHEVALEGREPGLLLADWLGELIFLAEVEGFVPEQVAELGLDDRGLHATIAGHRGRLRHLVKAVTLDGLELERRGPAWRAHVVLDV
jgi:SHS2 domain-containing protein